MKYDVLYSELLARDCVTITREMWPELSQFIKYCRGRGTELRGGFENGVGVTLFLK